MRIAEINMTSQGSTGRMMLDVAGVAKRRGYEVRTFSPRIFRKKFTKMPPSPDGHSYYGTYLESAVHLVLGIYLGFNGFGSYFATKSLVRKLKKFRPDVIHLHNLHNFCINFPVLFKYLKSINAKVVWTLHDCWTFTGHCPHFIIAECDRWKSGCYDCSQYMAYPKSRVDRSRLMYSMKKKWFTSLHNMTIVTPSHWLSDLVKQSYLKDYPVKVIHNGIDLNVFKPFSGDFRQRHNIGDRHIVLGVAFGWGEQKGLDVFTELAKRLDDNYRIVLVGTNEGVDKLLPDNIISVHRTHNRQVLAEIYTTADVFANATREEVLGFVNIEALACGTPVVTFRTGGSPEIIDETCGCIVDCNDIDSFEKEIRRVCEEKPYSEAACLEKAKEFDMNDRFSEYISLFN